MINNLEEILKIRWKLLVSFRTEILTEYLIQHNHEDVDRVFGLPYYHRLIIDNDIYNDEAELEKMWQIIRMDINLWYKKIFKGLKQKSSALLKYSRKINKVNFSRQSQEKMVVYFRQWTELYGQNLCLIGVPGRLDEVLELEINRNLADLKVVNQEAVFRIMAHSPKISGILQQKNDLIKLALELEDINSQEAISKINKHVKKFQWIYTTLLSGDLYSFDDLQSEIAEIKKEENLRQKLDEYKKSYKQSKQLLAQYEKKYNFSVKLNRLIKLLQEAVWFRTARLEWLNQACALARPLLYEIVKRVNLSYEDLIYLMPDEIVSLLNKETLAANLNLVIKKRQEKYSMYTLSGNNPIVLLGEDVDILKQSLLKNTVNVDELIKGISSSPGLVTGRVCIIKDRSEINKINPGEILVTKLTTPDFVPAMKKAKAILTDLGGITSHAAIVSRELGVPCIVGTKNATQVLKDGDMVEVDADKGIVRIIK